MQGGKKTVKPLAQAFKCLRMSVFASSLLKSMNFLGLLLYGVSILLCSSHEEYSSQK